MKITALIFGLIALSGLASPSPLRAQLIVSLDCLPSGGALPFNATVAPKDPAFAETSTALGPSTEVTALTSSHPPKSALSSSPTRSEIPSLGMDAWTSRNTPTSIARTTSPVVPPLTDAFSLSNDVGAEPTSLASLLNQLTLAEPTSERSSILTFSPSMAPRERRHER